MQIRSFKSSDIHAIQELVHATIHTINKRDYSPAHLAIWAPANKSAESWLELNHRIAYVVEDNGVIVGFGSMFSDGHLDHMYTHKDFQGRGIGRMIVEKLESEARSRGLQEIHTDASVTAHPFFEKMGFIVKRKKQNVKKGTGEVFTYYVMIKKLEK